MGLLWSYSAGIWCDSDVIQVMFVDFLGDIRGMFEGYAGVFAGFPRVILRVLAEYLGFTQELFRGHLGVIHGLKTRYSLVMHRLVIRDNFAVMQGVL